VETTIGLTDGLELDLGARYSEDTKETTKLGDLGVGSPDDQTVVFNPDGSPSGLLDPLNSALVRAAWGALSSYPHAQDLQRKENHVDPSVRLRWHINDDTMAYLSYTTGYKSGGFNASGDTANPDGTPGPGTEFEDEQAKAWELGVKSTLWDGRARVGATVFHTEIEDQQVTSFQGTTFLVSNAATLTSQGLELEGQVALNDHWELGASLAYLDSEYDDYRDAPCTIYQKAARGDGCVQDFSGERGPNAPEWSGTVYAQYEKPIYRDLLFRFNVDASYKDDYFLDGDLDPNVLQDSYVKLNARIGIGEVSGRWEVSLYGRNLTDESTQTFATDSPLSAGIYTAWLEEPRVVGMQATYNF
jgi:iron complex outermembrane receptor protein